MENKKTKIEIKKNNRNELILISIGIILIFIGGILFLTNGKKSDNKENNESSSNTENNNQENNNNENDEIEDIEDSNIEQIEINDQILALYAKYHSDQNPVELAGVSIEDMVYTNENYSIKDISDKIPYYTEKKILDLASLELNSVEDKSIVDETYAKDVVSKKAIEYFGRRLTLSSDILSTKGCWAFKNENGVFSFESHCGSTSPQKAMYRLIEAKKGSNCIYLYEKVTIIEENGDSEDFTYKYIYDLQEDGNYYFYKVKRIENY